MAVREHLVRFRAFALTLGMAALAFGLPGCGSSDKDKITSVLKTTEVNPKDWCTTKFVTPAFIASVGGEQKCLQSFGVGKDLKISSITINGNSAVAKVSDNTGPGTAFLVKQGSDWKIDRAQSG